MYKIKGKQKKQSAQKRLEEEVTVPVNNICKYP
jgi:hypothetical protein